MESLPERIEAIEKDNELTQRLLGALGLVWADTEGIVNPEHTDSVWKSIN